MIIPVGVDSSNASSAVRPLSLAKKWLLRLSSSDPTAVTPFSQSKTVSTSVFTNASMTTALITSEILKNFRKAFPGQNTGNINCAISTESSLSTPSTRISVNFPNGQPLSNIRRTMSIS